MLYPRPDKPLALEIPTFSRTLAIIFNPDPGS